MMFESVLSGDTSGSAGVLLAKKPRPVN